jgi:hypothetical protein
MGMTRSHADDRRPHEEKSMHHTSGANEYGVLCGGELDGHRIAIVPGGLLATGLRETSEGGNIVLHLWRGRRAANDDMILEFLGEFPVGDEVCAYYEEAHQAKHDSDYEGDAQGNVFRKGDEA